MDIDLNKESEIRDIENFADPAFAGEENPELIHATPSSLLYRIKRDGKYFIIKRIAIKGERGRRILRREYELSIGNDHPNIVNVYEYRHFPGGEEEIVMEYVEGRTLDDFLGENPSFKTRKRVFSELLDAISYLHKRRIIHNDLKPSNILISRNGDHVKLIDLGLSDDDAHFEIKTPGFTGGYAAPELVENRSSDPRSDIYSLGIIMRRVFGGSYSGIVKKCLNTCPEKRYKDVEALRRRWESDSLKWIIPIWVLAGILLAAVLWVLFGMQSNQNHKLVTLEETVGSQAKELERQLSVNKELQRSYLIVKDSLDRVVTSNLRHQRLKEQALSGFKARLNNLAASTLDSIKQTPDWELTLTIRQNFYKAARDLYDRQEKVVDGEDISPQLHSLLYEIMERADKVFNYHIPAFRQ